jgi:hypothetical protein
MGLSFLDDLGTNPRELYDGPLSAVFAISGKGIKTPR